MVEVAKTAGREPRKEAVKKERRRRKGMGLDANLKLHVPEEAKDPNFHYHFLNGTEARMYQKTVRDDYDIVTVEMLENEKRKKRGESEIPIKGEGTPYKVPVGVGKDGKALDAFLVRKPKESYEQDKKEEQESIADAESAIKEGPVSSAEGLNKGDHSYVPQGHVNVID
jgi:hypothetical protein